MQQLQSASSLQQVIDLPTVRIGTLSTLTYARGVAFAVMVAAYVMQQVQLEKCQLGIWVTELSEKSVLLLIYAVLIKILLDRGVQNCSALLSESAHSALLRVSSSDTMLRIRSSLSSSSMRLFSLSGGGDVKLRGSKLRSSPFSANEPFLALDKIAKLTLFDMKNIFQFAVESKRPSFDRRAFNNKVSKNCKQAIAAIDDVCNTFRGSTPSPVPDRSIDRSDKKNIDALLFAAAVRIFAEWRSLRLIPDGTSGRYAMGMNMARRDLLQNLAKLESAIHNFIKHQKEIVRDPADKRPVVQSPSLRQLLKYEIEQNMHRSLPRVAEKSGASGLLWISRQLQYQTSVFANLVRVPDTYSCSKTAVIAAYKATYENVHGYMVRRLFQSTFDVAPPAEAILMYMNIPAQQQGSKSDSTERTTKTRGRAGSQRNALSAQQPQNPVQQMLRNIRNGLSKVRNGFGPCTGQEELGNQSQNALTVPPPESVTFVAASKKGEQPASDDIPGFVAFMQELVTDLFQMIEEFNMNDPTRV